MTTDWKSNYRAVIASDVSSRDGLGWEFATSDGVPVWAVLREDGGAFPVFSATRGEAELSTREELLAMTVTACRRPAGRSGSCRRRRMDHSEPCGRAALGIRGLDQLGGRRVGARVRPGRRPQAWASPVEGRMPFAWLRALSSGGRAWSVCTKTTAYSGSTSQTG